MSALPANAYISNAECSRFVRLWTSKLIMSSHSYIFLHSPNKLNSQCYKLCQDTLFLSRCRSHDLFPLWLHSNNKGEPQLYSVCWSQHWFLFVIKSLFINRMVNLPKLCTSFKENISLVPISTLAHHHHLIIQSEIQVNWLAWLICLIAYQHFMGYLMLKFYCKS